MKTYVCVLLTLAMSAPLFAADNEVKQEQVDMVRKKAEEAEKAAVYIALFGQPGAGA